MFENHTFWRVCVPPAQHLRDGSLWKTWKRRFYPASRRGTC